MAAVSVEHFTDPFSPRCWAAQPSLRRLRYDFDDVEWRPRMTVLLPDDPAALPDGAEDAEQLRAAWAEVAASTGMPVAEALWPGRLPTSRPACAAVAFVRGTAPGRALAVLRAFRVAAFADGRALDDPEDVASVAGAVPGVDGGTVRRALDDGRAASALAEDLARGVEVAAELGSVEVRGDVSRLPLAPRFDPSALPPGVAGMEGARGTSSGATDEGAGERGPRVDEGEREADAEPTLLGPGALRVEGPGTAVVDVRLPYGRQAGAFGRSVPRTGPVIDDKYATSRMAMHVPREVAESLSSEDFREAVRPYLARFGRAYLPEVAAGTGLSRETCLEALEALVGSGEAERVGPAEWRTVDDPGAPRRDA